MELDKIFESVQSEVLTEDVKKKISVLIETKVNEKVNSRVEELDKLFEDYKEKELNKLEEKAVEYVDYYLIEKIDEYMDYVAEEYVKENKLEIESGIKAQLYDSIVEGVKDVLSKNQIKEDKIEEMEDVSSENKNLKEELNKVMKENMELKKKDKIAVAVSAFNEIAEGLSVSEKSKLQTLAGDFDIDDIEEFKEKVYILKESISHPSQKTITENNEETSGENDIVDGDAELYVHKEKSKVYEDFGEMMSYL